MHDAVDFLQHTSMARALTDRERDRCRVITARLRRFTQGMRAAVFDRPSTFSIDDGPVAIGLRSFAMNYGADLTPALAILLTAILAALAERRGRMVIVVDEAHRVTSDPDAGEVLGQLVRQARKHGAGVWMLSQRVEDFVRTDLGRTLAATAASKLVLGTEEAVLDDVREVFKLRDEEIAAICPSTPGRGVLLAGAERTVVDVVPGPAIMALADTRSTAAPAARVASAA
jgi:type IV secretory pathway VirB4 component